MILLVLLISFVLISSLYFLNLTRLTGMFIGFGQPQSAEWWNISWQYRFRFEINSTQYNRTDWPIEQQINFTDLLPSGTFDINSTRVFEYSSGSILYEIPSQFEVDENYNATNNAIGTLVFLMNGTTNANTNRTFYVYYDSIENGAKENPNYTININYNWDGEEINVNNSFLSINIDTNRSENTSGIYRVYSGEDYLLDVADESNRTAEYLEYSNGTYNFSFDLIGNASFTNGSVRLIIEQVGDEIIFGYPSQKTNEGQIIKRYYIYDKAGPQSQGIFIKIWQRFSNNAGYSIDRNSTFSGALAFDVERTFDSGNVYSHESNTTNPYSWSRTTGGTTGAWETLGIINLNQTGTSNYFANYTSEWGRVGLQLNNTTITSGSYIEQTSVVYLAPTGGGLAIDEFENIRDRFINPISITQYLPEVWYVDIDPSTNETIYNKNETILITGNISDGDSYNLTEYMNATLDMGTIDSGDDQTIILYDDGNHEDGAANDSVFANSFQIPNNGELGIWTINFTTYSNNSEFLNSTNYTFNVTDILNVSVNINNPTGLTGRTVFANISVKNYRTDIWIPGSTLNCSYDSTEVTNKTDWGDGNYSVNFTAPIEEGDYNLSCNATWNNNTGNDTDSFITESAKINVSITAQPSNFTLNNVGLYENESFVTAINATNLGNGTAYNSNISLNLLGGWDANETIEQCGNINKTEFCIKGFNITAPNATSPGNYYINVSVNWTNPDDSFGTNQTTLNVTISSNPKVNVSEETLTAEAGDGVNIYVFNFTVISIGNDALQNITFNCSEGDVCNNFVVNFTPQNISSLNVDENYSVAVNVTVPLGYTVGTYNGTVNVSAENDDYKNLTLNISVAAKTNASITFDPSNYTSQNLTQLANESFILNITIMDISNGSARYTNISLNVPSNLSSNSTFENCNNLTKGEVCLKAFNITILKGANPGNYYINVSVNWTNPDNSLGVNQTSFNVTVESNPLVNVSETVLSQNVSDATNVYIGNFTVLSIGIGALQNITFNCSEGDVCNNFVINFTPQNISTLDMNENYSVAVNVTVPLGYTVGTYNGTVNVSAENDDYKNLTLNITVPSNRTWTMIPSSCDKSESSDEGTVCEVLVRNLGNDIINFTITPEEGNYTKVNVTNFSISDWTNYTFNVTYNITPVGQGVYNSIFIVDANQTNANPDNMTLNVTLYPFLAPLINFTVTPNLTEQNSSILILANVTERSGTGIQWVNITVIKPDESTNETNMTLINLNGSFSQWNFTYPDYGLGNTTLRGNYSVRITAIDNIGNIDNSTKNFSIHSKLLITSATLSGTYLQGDSGSIYHIVKNDSGIGVSGINVTFTIRDSNNNVTYSATGQTDSEGTIYPLPTFSLASDAPTGTYTLFSNSTYFDDALNHSIVFQRNSTFLVNARTITVTGLFADIETAVTWYPNNIMRFGILIYNGEGRPVDPDDMNLTVYDPADNVYFFTGLSNMIKEATGFYTYSYAMGAGTATGMYLAVLNVSQDTFETKKLKAFRVSQGGPYDVEIVLFENEVPQGDYLDFAINVENKGEVGQDVSINFWVSDANNVTYYNYSHDVYTPAVSNQSVTEQAFIYSDQPLGNYYLNVKVSYSTIQPPIIAYTSFVVVTGEGFIFPPPLPPPPPIYYYGPVGGFVTTYPPEPTAKIRASIIITNYKTNISLARGFTKIESVTVKNNGISNLTNVSLFVIGVPTNWFNITPEKYAELEPDNSSIFLIEFNIPKNTKVDEYDANIIASSGVVTDQKAIKITIFESLEDLIRDDIRKLKRDLEDLKVDTRIAEMEGKNVSAVLLVINETENQIYGAEIDLENNDTEAAMDKIQNAIDLIKKARDLLEGLKVEKVPEIFPIWIIFVILIIIAAIVFIIMYLWKKKKLEKIRPYIIPLSKLVKTVKRRKVSIEKLKGERDKINRMLRVLEREKRQGIISARTYEKMKKSLEEKLEKIEKKLE